MSQQVHIVSANQSTSSTPTLISTSTNTNNRNQQQSCSNLTLIQQPPSTLISKSTSTSLTSAGQSSSAGSGGDSSDDSSSILYDNDRSRNSQEENINNPAADQISPESVSWTTEDEDEEDIEIEQEEDGSGTESELEEIKPVVLLPIPKAVEVKPLKARVKLVVERALVNRLNENRLPNPRSPWIRRQIDIFILRMFVFMMQYHRELCIIFLMCASGLASFRSSPVKTRATPTPKPFFENPEGLKYIEDYYRGEYVDLVQRKITLGPAFVFYYAPWDSESVAARDVFVTVAQYFEKTIPGRVRFFAVNCWWPEGECRKNYKNLSHFPILVAHLEKNSGIIYSGPIRAKLIIKFLNSLLKPMTRIDSEEEVWRFRAQHDAVMLGYFNFTDPESVQAYETYLQMALRNFEADPFGQVGFGLFLRPELAEKFFLTSSNVISLVLFNEIHTAKWSGDKQTQGMRGPVGQVANWVMERTRKTPITWAYQLRTGFANRPVALGPMDLVDELSKGPVMLLITRRYFPSSYSPFYSQLKEVALDYFNCNKSGNVTKLRRTTHKINSEWMTLWNSVAKVCINQTKNVSESCSMLKEQLLHWQSKKNALRRESLANYEMIAERRNFTGFACASERQFKFFAIDPVDMPYFVELGLGGLGYTKESDPVLFVIDAQNDIILPVVSFNISSLTELIYNYTKDSESNEELSSSFTSHYWASTSVSTVATPSRNHESITEPAQHYSFIRELVGDSDKTERKEITSYELSEEEQQQRPPQGQGVRTITSEDLLKFLGGVEPFHLPHPMFVMFTAKFCGACGISLASFLELSRFLSEYYYLGVNVTFAKLDMFKNSLPLELTPHKLPTFVYFPAENRTDSRVYPAGEAVTTKSLLKFLLAEMDPVTRVKLSLLSPGCKGDEDCAKDAKNINRLSLQSKCSSSQDGVGLSNSSSSSAARDSCLHVNRATVSDKIQNILDDIQNGFYSQVQSEIEDQRVEVLIESKGWSVEPIKTQDLEHLRSMKLTLDVS